ncbi:MAG: four helix bundle protein [Planctomycetota bacterium]|jgi:four helix bundle protein
MPVKDYRELIAWQKAMDLVEMVYRLTDGYPQGELYGLTSQMRRAAVSIPSNIAEGQGRSTTRDFLNFLSIATGPLKEVETQGLISRRLGFLDEPQTAQLLDLTTEVARVMSGLTNSLRRKSR